MCIVFTKQYQQQKHIKFQIPIQYFHQNLAHFAVKMWIFSFNAIDIAILNIFHSKLLDFLLVSWDFVVSICIDKKPNKLSVWFTGRVFFFLFFVFINTIVVAVAVASFFFSNLRSNSDRMCVCWVHLALAAKLNSASRLDEIVVVYAT